MSQTEKKTKKSPPPPASPASSTLSDKWSFLTNHLHVILCLHRDSNTTVRELAALIGITERSVQRILSELEEAKAISRKKEGRRNVYQIRHKFRLRHNLEKNHTIGELLELLEE